MVAGGRFLYLLLTGMTILLGTLECREVECFKCSWTGSQELDDDKMEALDDIRKEMESKSVPIDNPLTEPYIISKVVPDKAVLQSNCKKCKLPDGKCVKWTFHLNDIVQNATYMCVQSVTDGELGIFTQNMPGGVLKKVVICNTDYCNSISSGRVRPSVFLQCLLVIFLIFSVH